MLRHDGRYLASTDTWLYVRGVSVEPRSQASYVIVENWSELEKWSEMSFEHKMHNVNAVAWSPCGEYILYACDFGTEARVRSVPLPEIDADESA